MSGSIKRKGILIVLFVYVLITSLYAANSSSFSDSMEFQIELLMYNRWIAVLKIDELDDNPLEYTDDGRVRDLTIEDSATEYGLCKLVYDTNLPNSQTLNLVAHPLYRVNENNVRYPDEAGIGYDLRFEIRNPGLEMHGESLEVFGSLENNDCSISIIIPNDFDENFVSSTVDVYVTFSSFESMEVGGRYLSLIEMGISGT